MSRLCKRAPFRTSVPSKMSTAADPKRRTIRVGGKASALGRVPAQPIGSTKAILGPGTRPKRNEMTPNQLSLNLISKALRSDYNNLSTGLIQQYEADLATMPRLHILNPFYLAAARVIIGEAERQGKDILKVQPFDIPFDETTMPILRTILTTLDLHTKKTQKSDGSKNAAKAAKTLSEGNADILGPEDRRTRQKMVLLNYIIMLTIHLRSLAGEEEEELVQQTAESPDDIDGQPPIIG